MTSRFKRLAEAVAPPVIVRGVSRWRGGMTGHRWFGPQLESWEAAAEQSVGYDAPTVLARVRESTDRVARGDAAYERDSLTFSSLQYEPVVVAGLLLAARLHREMLHVVDFGGALGSHFFQHRTLLDEFGSVRWSVVEQAHFVECGRQQNHDDRLVFFDDIASSVAGCPPSMGVMSAVLSWVPDPIVVIEAMVAAAPAVVAVDRTIVSAGSSRTFHVQSVPRSIYQASYPICVLPESEVIHAFTDSGYRLVAEIDRDSMMSAVRTIGARFKGYLFVRDD